MASNWFRSECTSKFDGSVDLGSAIHSIGRAILANAKGQTVFGCLQTECDESAHPTDFDVPGVRLFPKFVRAEGVRTGHRLRSAERRLGIFLHPDHRSVGSMRPILIHSRLRSCAQYHTAGVVFNRINIHNR